MKEQFESIVKQISSVLLGKEPQVRLALTCLFARGHLLIEDLPGIGKTTLAKVLAKCMGLDFQRIQFTSDMLPGDILGVSVFDQKAGTFHFHPGPIFTQVLLADEINRATPKTQSALLEAMEEQQVTIEGETRVLKQPFFVIATQNPLEHSGTFPLPESQMDRFLMRITLGYPDRAAEKKILKGEGAQAVLAAMGTCMMHDDVSGIQAKISQVRASDTFLDYLQDIIHFTRSSPHFQVGLSPRAGLALQQASRAWAHMEGRDFMVPEDLQVVLPWVAGHRLRSRSEGLEIPNNRLMELFSRVPVPL
ncbi:MAG: AAA family ATPase [Desulfobacterales bacterium CG23_combo_of_CG06-09_8_20_14_all_51_8]|nr:MAG: AAA family ATPase [Desulfobacterales bacterium CG23_combo_of_CG06-09_8_20_14_all_51_8]